MKLKSADLEVLLESADLEYRSLDATMHFQEYTNGCNWFYIESALIGGLDPSIAIYPLVASSFTTLVNMKETRVHTDKRSSTPLYKREYMLKIFYQELTEPFTAQ